MSSRIPAGHLFRIRNEIDVARLIEHELRLPWKRQEGIFRFLCPVCSEFHTATHPKTNLARCFRCERNFNTIDLVMVCEACSFIEAVNRLEPILTGKPAESRGS